MASNLDRNGATMAGDKGGYRQINSSLNICAFEDYLKSQTDNLPELPDVEQITPRVLRVLGQNPGKVCVVYTKLALPKGVELLTCRQSFVLLSPDHVDSSRTRAPIHTLSALANTASSWTPLAARLNGLSCSSPH